MDLTEFISKTLIDIRNGVDLANKELTNSKPFKLNDFGRAGSVPIKFDLAVTVSDSVGGNGGGEINVFAASIGGKANFNVGHETVSRIQFQIDPGHD